MFEEFTLEAKPRTIIGKQVKQLRREDIVPAVVYGHGSSIAIQLNGKEVRNYLRNASTNDIINLNMAGDTRMVLISEVQRHVTRRDVMHIDFHEIKKGEMISAEVSLTGIGKAAEVADIGQIVLVLQSIEIDAIPTNLISELEVDFSLIKTANDRIHVRDLKAPAGVKITTDPGTVVAIFEYERRIEEEEEAELDPNNVQVIGSEED